MRQSHVENEHYSTLFQNELTVPIKALGLPPHRVRVLALFTACTSSYAHESAFTLGRYIEYTCGTLNMR